jgi:hypothetical protein
MTDMTNEELDKLLGALIGRFAVAMQSMSVEQMKVIVGPIGEKAGAVFDKHVTVENVGPQLVSMLVKLGYGTDCGRDGEPVLVSPKKAKLSFTQAIRLELDDWFREYVITEAEKALGRKLR